MNFDLDEGIAVLERTPGALRALLAGLPDGWMSADEGPDTFTPLDNVCHLIHGERTDWWRRDAPPNAGDVGHARPRPPGAGIARHGETLPRRCRPVACVPARTGPLTLR